MGAEQLSEAVGAEDLSEAERMLNRFHRLLREVERGAILRNTFEPWELAILLDLDSCPFNPRRRRETLRRYIKAVDRQMTHGPGPPMLPSEYIARKKARFQSRITRRPSIRYAPLNTMPMASE